jgi:hypothetical protein
MASIGRRNLTTPGDNVKAIETEHGKTTESMQELTAKARASLGPPLRVGLLVTPGYLPKGGTLLGKVDLGFFRMSEDADLVLPGPPSRRGLRNVGRMQRVGDAIGEVAGAVGVSASLKRPHRRARQPRQRLRTAGGSRTASPSR